MALQRTTALRKSEGTRSPSRIPALDGLRGIAALVVVIHHCMLTVPELSKSVTDAHAHDVGSLTWWVTHTPVHLLWDGTEAVFVFFVLSGFVLSLPIAEGRGAAWMAYYPRRLCRLYIPAAAGLVLALLTVAVVARPTHVHDSGWVAMHAAQPHGLAQALRALLLVGGSSVLDTPLWSLKWEVVFSVCLPLYVLGSRVFQGWWPLKTAGLLALIAIGEDVGSGILLYLPMFALGSLMAFERTRLTTLCARIGGKLWCVVAVVGLLLVNSWWTVYASTSHAHWLVYVAGLARSLSVVGAIMVIGVAMHWSAAGGALNSRPIRWLGKRSFSLYLVHEPILIAIVFSLGGNPPLALTLALTIPAALVAAELFRRVAEEPALRLSRLIGRWVDRPTLWRWRGAAGTPPRTV